MIAPLLVQVILEKNYMPNKIYFLETGQQYNIIQIPNAIELSTLRDFMETIQKSNTCQNYSGRLPLSINKL